MANKTIVELDEISLADIADGQLMVLDTGLATFKVRLENLFAFAFGELRRVVDVVYNGSETGAKTVDVSTYTDNAQLVIWQLKKPLGSPTFGEQIQAKITTTDESTVVIDTGDFALDAGNYILLGV